MCNRINVLVRQLYALGLGDQVDAIAERLVGITAIEAGEVN
jgi:hypothetical protein